MTNEQLQANLNKVVRATQEKIWKGEFELKNTADENIKVLKCGYFEFHIFKGFSISQINGEYFKNSFDLNLKVEGSPITKKIEEVWKMME